MWKERPFTHLRPGTIAETMDRALVTWYRFAPILFLGSLVGASDYLMSLVIHRWKGLDASTPAIVGSLLFLMLLGDFLAAIGYLAVFQGLLFPLRPTSPKALLRTAIRKLPGFFFTQYFYLVTVVFFALLGWGYLTSSAHSGQRIVNAFIGLGALMAALWLAVRLSLAAIVSLIEETTPLKACRRSIHLTSTLPSVKDSHRDMPVIRWLVLGILPAGLILTVCVVTLAIATQTQHLQWPLQWADPVFKDIRNVAAFTASFLAVPFYRAGLMAFYIEYRMRHEALDFYLRLRELRRSPQSPPLSTI